VVRVRQQREGGAGRRISKEAPKSNRGLLWGRVTGGRLKKRVGESRQKGGPAREKYSSRSGASRRALEGGGQDNLKGRKSGGTEKEGD